MNAHTRISEKGQVVVPKATRDRLGWQPGTDLEVIEGRDAITLRRKQSQKMLTVEESLAQLRQLYRHEGPKVSIEKLSWSSDFADRDA